MVKYLRTSNFSWRKAYYINKSFLEIPRTNLSDDREYYNKHLFLYRKPESHYIYSVKHTWHFTPIQNQIFDHNFISNEGVLPNFAADLPCYVWS